MAHIEIRVPAGGKGLSTGGSQVVVTAHGFTGGACLLATHDYLAAIGTVQESQPTPELYAEPEILEMVRQG